MEVLPVPKDISCFALPIRQRIISVFSPWHRSGYHVHVRTHACMFVCIPCIPAFIHVWYGMVWHGMVWYVCVDAWMHGCMDGWMDGSHRCVCTNFSLSLYIYIFICMYKPSCRFALTVWEMSPCLQCSFVHGLLVRELSANLRRLRGQVVFLIIIIIIVYIIQNPVLIIKAPILGGIVLFPQEEDFVRGCQFGDFPKAKGSHMVCTWGFIYPL